MWKNVYFTQLNMKIYNWTQKEFIVMLLNNSMRYPDEVFNSLHQDKKSYSNIFVSKLEIRQDLVNN